MIQLVRRWTRRLTPSPRRADALVLMYHRFSTGDPDPWSLGISPEHFADHLTLIRKRYRPVSLAQLVQELKQGEIAPRSVVITADDGYADNAMVAAPLLGKADVPATFFVTTDGIDRTEAFWWDTLDELLLVPARIPDQLALPQGIQWSGDVAHSSGNREVTWRATEPTATNRQRLYLSCWQALYRMNPQDQSAAIAALRASCGMVNTAATHRTMTRHEIQEVAGRYPVEIGAHGCSHRPLDGLGAPELTHEIRHSALLLRDIVGGAVQSFAFPHGAHDHAAQLTVAECGLTSACTTITGGVSAGADPHALPRLHVHDWSADDLEQHLLWWLGS